MLALVVREAVTNVQRHAQAHNVRIDLDVRGEQVVLVVADDGTDPQDASTTKDDASTPNDAGKDTSTPPDARTCKGGDVVDSGVCEYYVHLCEPPRFWDGIVTWDKWAMDWGHRHSLRGYLFAYSQLLPMFSSLAYKLLATVDGDLPPALCGVHALHPLLGLVLLTAMWRLARLLGLPAWAALIALFGTRVLQDHVGAGTADLLVTTLGTTAVALHVASWREPPAAA